MFPEEHLTPQLRDSFACWNAEWARQGLPVDGNIEADPNYAKALTLIRAHAPAGTWNVFFEAGCGTGKNSLIMAREHKVMVVGMDACLEACKLAKRLLEREGQSGFFVVGDLRQLPFRAGVFDYTYAGGSMEHFSDTQAAVSEAFRVTKTQGRVLATVPVISLATLTYRQLWGNIPELPVVRPIAEWVHMRLLQGRHMRFGYEKSFLPGTFMRFFRTAGFVRVGYGYVDAHLDFTLLPWEWLKTLARGLARWRLFWPMIWVEADR
jgi:ubiquinone/menaquinone biosynthesis C-methylase UbiE